MPTRRANDANSARGFLDAIDKETDQQGWDAETIKAWALCAIAFGVADLTEAVRDLDRTLRSRIPMPPEALRRPEQTQHIGMPPVIADNTVHPPTITNEGPQS